MASILVLNGPNLNLLGTREPGIYGAATLADVEALCHATAKAHGHTVTFLQSNHEGALIDALHEAGRAHRAGELIGVVFNAGGYTHTSVALRDALAAVDLPFIEIHLSNPHAREPFRQHSYFSDKAVGVICGFGADSYRYARDAALTRLAATSA